MDSNTVLIGHGLDRPQLEKQAVIEGISVVGEGLSCVEGVF